jgi:hypothetical protein
MWVDDVDVVNVKVLLRPEFPKLAVIGKQSWQAILLVQLRPLCLCCPSSSGSCLTLLRPNAPARYVHSVRCSTIQDTPLQDHLGSVVGYLELLE